MENMDEPTTTMDEHTPTSYCKRREYFRAYQKRRYHEDATFRQAVLNRMHKNAESKRNKLKSVELELKQTSILIV